MIDHHEEPWEAEISLLLGGLGSVEAPEGFLEQAIDRRPPAAGRAIAGLLAAVVALAAIGVATGLTDATRSISPDFDALETRHRTIDPATVDPAVTADDLPPGVPEGFVVVDRLDDGPWDHEVVSRARGAVSVFRQSGSLDVSGLDGTWRTVGATEVWVTSAGPVMFEHDGEVFVVVGLEADQLVEPRPSSVAERVGDFIGDLTRELGFPSP